MYRQSLTTGKEINFSFGGKRKKNLIQFLKIRKEPGEKVGSVSERKQEIMINTCLYLLIKGISDFCESPETYERNLKTFTRKPNDNEVDFSLPISESLYYFIQNIYGDDWEQFSIRTIRYEIDRMINLEFGEEINLSSYSLSWFKENHNSLKSKLNLKKKSCKLFEKAYTHEKRNIISGTFNELQKQNPLIKCQDPYVIENLEKLYKSVINYKERRLSRNKYIDMLLKEYLEVNGKLNQLKN